MTMKSAATEAVRPYLLPFATSLPAIMLTEAFYKFGSFTLELVGFIATWAAVYGITRVIAKVARLLAR